jgi:hypothetical protein
MTEGSKPLFVADPCKGIKVDAAVIATPFRDEIKAKVAKMKEKGMGTCFHVQGQNSYCGTAKHLLLCIFRGT